METNSKEVQRITDIETAFQNRLEQLLEGVPAELKAELEESDKFETSRSGILRQANQALIARQLYTVYQNLYADLEELEDVDLASSHFQDLFSQLRTHFKAFTKEAIEVVNDVRVKPLVNSLRDRVNRVSQEDMAKGKEHKQSKNEVPRLAQAIKDTSRGTTHLNIDLLSLDGQLCRGSPSMRCSMRL